MKRIGDVMQHISIPIARGSATPAAKPPACSICQDAGFVRGDFPVGHPKFGSIFPCECRVRERAERQREQLSSLTNLDAFQDKTLERFDPTVPGVVKAYQEALDFVESPTRWLFLHGGCGVGKTHLAAGIAIEVFRREPRWTVIFQVVPDLLDHLRATFDPSAGSGYDERFNAFRNANLLVLDDLGTENTTPWAREKLYQLFNHRYNQRLATVVTSNQDLRQIEERVRSRLLDRELTRYIEIDADDFRTPHLPRQITSRRR